MSGGADGIAVSGVGRRRGSYFFVIDAFFAAAILTFTVVLIFSLFVVQPRTGQSYSYAQDYLTFLTGTGMRDFRHAAIIEIMNDPTLRPYVDSRRSLSEQVLVFYNRSAEGNPTLKGGYEAILEAAAENLPETLTLNVWLRDPEKETSVKLYGREAGSVSETKTRLNARALEYVMLNETDIYGPLVLQVEVLS